jgi:hypothetical protein
MFPQTIRVVRAILIGLGALAIGSVGAHATASNPPPPMETVRVADDRRGFILEPSGRAFVPVGFNYDHDEQGRLIEDYWNDEWPKIEEDFREMRDLGANVVRIHLQLGRFLKDADTPNPQALDRLGRLLELSERLGLYLDLTGLGCYHKRDIPAWYDQLDEPGRWAAQARFWEAIAQRCSTSPAVFCHDLMNEPVVPGGRRQPGDWLGPAFGDKHFVQFLTLDQADRPRADIAKAWVRALVTAIRRHDRRHLITVGLVPWSLDRPKTLTSGTPPEALIDDLDFLCVHLYPERGKLDEAIDTLRGFALGKPVVIEETFPLKIGLDEFGEFLDRSRPLASGWIGFYWGKTPDELRRSGTIGDALLRGWLDLFQARLAPAGRLDGQAPHPSPPDRD